MFTGTVQELGLPARAVGALARAGITTVDELATLTRRDLSAVPGLGPAMVAAIRAVVPEPVAQGLWPLPDDEEGPASPAIPSFASLRGPRRRSALDLLVPEPGAAGTADHSDEGSEDEDMDEDTDADPAAPADDVAPEPPRAARPAEWADLAVLGARGARAAALLPWRVALWWVQVPVRCVGRLRPRS